jgi:transmembrane sensor
MMRNDEAKHLLDKFLSGDCTPEELLLIKRAYNAGIPDHDIDISEERYEEMRLSMWSKLNGKASLRIASRRPWVRIAAAAAILVILGTGLHYFYPGNSSGPVHPRSNYAKDIAPGGNKAVLTLANGKKISLTDIRKGQITNQAGIRIAKTKDGELVYTITDHRNAAGPLAFNTIETPKGGQYHIHLPDGTMVLLNAASSLKFPTRFTGNSRTVLLSGEGYFEVAKDRSKPFRVITSKQQVEVLGTHFNINAYADEKAIKTTLLEGSVKISVEEHKSIVLSPGQQSLFDEKGIMVKNVDVENITAWKENYFIFNDDNLEGIMRQVARWYNVEVRYVGNPPDLTFTGAISRTKNISSVLNALQETGNADFKIEGKTIIVTEKTKK